MKRILGIDIGGTSVKMGILDKATGDMVDISQFKSFGHEPDKLADAVAAAALTYNADIVGVGTTGGVNLTTNTVNSSNLSWKNVPLRKLLEERMQRQVWVDNDSKSAMMAEVFSGVCKDKRCAVFITLGTSLGAGLIIDGKPWRGDDNTAFELGHIITHAHEYDGTGETRAGRLEYYASAQGIERNNGGRPAREVIEGVIAREPHAMKIYDQFMFDLAIGLFTTIELFKPEVIGLGGGLCAVGDYLIEGLHRKFDELYAHRSKSAAGIIKLARHQNNAGMIGAAALAELFLFK